jgi:hypothetical protein
VVRCEEDTHTAAADEDSSNLSPLVADVEEGERDDDNTDDRPEVEELRLRMVSVERAYGFAG